MSYQDFIQALARPQDLPGRNINIGRLAGQPLEKVVADADRDFIMDAEEAKAYGLVDHVISRRER